MSEGSVAYRNVTYEYEPVFHLCISEESVVYRSVTYEYEPVFHLCTSEGSVAYRNVTYEYEPGHPVLHNVSFEVPGGRTIAFVVSRCFRG